VVPAVKSPPPGRAARARETRRRLLASARALFVAQGYAATTMEQIAAQAGVAVQTVYYGFGTKGRLLCEVVEVTAAGEDAPAPVAQRPWAIAMRAAPSAQRVLALGVEHGTAIYERVASLWPAVGAAAAVDSAVEQYWRGVAAARRAGMGRMVARVAELGQLRPGLDPARAVDVVAVLVGHDVFRGLVLDAGWPAPAYKAWLFTTLVHQLLPPGHPDPAALAGLSFGDLVAPAAVPQPGLSSGASDAGQPDPVR